MNIALLALIAGLTVWLWIAALVDCMKSNLDNRGSWALVIIVLPFLGSILYLLFGRSRYVSEL